jgi:hypothetical protein
MEDGMTFDPGLGVKVTCTMFVRGGLDVLCPPHAARPLKGAKRRNDFRIESLDFMSEIPCE